MTGYPGVWASRVVWGERIEGGVREILAAADAKTVDDSEGGSLADAKRFLADLLADGPVPAKGVRADADGAGHTWPTIRRAQKALGIEATKTGMKGGWVWALPRRRSENPEDAQQNNVSIFGKVEHLRDDSEVVEVEL